MTSEELRAVVEATRNLKRWDSSVPMVRMIDTMHKHADALVELVAACERLRTWDSSWSEYSARIDAVTAALAAVHAVGQETT